MTTPTQSRQATAEQVALAHARQQAMVRAMILAAVLQRWLEGPVTSIRDVFGWWFGGARDEVFTALSFGQEMMAREAPDYVFDSLTMQGYDARVPNVDPLQFAATASDGRDLDTLLDQTVWGAWRDVEDDDFSLAEALARAEVLLREIVMTQLTDAGREADQVALTGSDIVGTLSPAEVERYEPVTPAARPPGRTGRTFPADFTPQGPIDPTDPNSIDDPFARRERELSLAQAKRANGTPVGWVRMLTPPSCGRCAILAGRWYGWNEGFQRHPNCDCRHIPAPESDAGELTVDPLAYFESLTIDEQDDYFGQAVAEAIRNGADVVQTVNAQNRKGGTYTVDGRQYTREGVTRKGYYGSRTEAGLARVKRMTPLAIYREAGDDIFEARRLLRRFGYLVD